MIDVDHVKTWIPNASALTVTDLDRVTAATNAVNGWLLRVRPDLDPDPAAVWPAEVAFAGAQLAARWFTRSTSGAGDQYDGYNGPLPVADHDLARFLGVGAHHRPVIA